jgi:hypothetical protein
MPRQDLESCVQRQRASGDTRKRTAASMPTNAEPVAPSQRIGTQRDGCGPAGTANEPDPKAGAALLDDLMALVQKYIFLSSHQAAAETVSVTHTHSQ